MKYMKLKYLIFPIIIIILIILFFITKNKTYIDVYDDSLYLTIKYDVLKNNFYNKNKKYEIVLKNDELINNHGLGCFYVIKNADDYWFVIGINEKDYKAIDIYEYAKGKNVSVDLVRNLVEEQSLFDVIGPNYDAAFRNDIIEGNHDGHHH